MLSRIVEKRLVKVNCVMKVQEKTNSCVLVFRQLMYVYTFEFTVYTV